jgi:hypothetical protein
MDIAMPMPRTIDKHKILNRKGFSTMKRPSWAFSKRTGRNPPLHAAV